MPSASSRTARASRDPVPARVLGGEQAEADRGRAATRSVTRRSSQTTASHMKIGNSTATKRGSDISGCGVTGKLSGRTSEAATHTP